MQRRVIADHSGPKLLRRVTPKQRPALVRVSFRKQSLRRNLHELRIPVVRVAVRISEFERLNEGVDVRGGIRDQTGHIHTVENVESLEHGRPLAPEPWLVNAKT